jgi:transcriptional regulator with XRE-family HTH domain
LTAWRVEFHPDFIPEFAALSLGVRREILAQATLLSTIGPTLGRPSVDTLKGSRIPNLKELRCTAEGGVWRVAFAFDGQRVAVLLVAGDKRGVSRDRFYRRLIALAEQRFATWRRRRRGDEEDGAMKKTGSEKDRVVKNMAAGISLEDMIAQLPPEEQTKVHARAEELIAEEMSLRDLRKAMGKTQVALAKKLHLKQEAISRAEQRTDMLLSTLDHYLQALGGRLRLVAEFEGRAPVTLAGLSAVGREPSRTKRRRAAAAPSGKARPKRSG